MEARLISAALLAAALLSLAASYRTQNFVVTAATQDLATDIGESAERYRRDLAVEWLGAELPPWRDPCPITAQVSPQLGAGGATSFMFERGRPFGWTMSIQGSRERVLDSVLPHEITHTIFATHFGRPLPRWADEGACTTVEHDVEKRKQQHLLIQFLTSRPSRGIAFNRMFAMKEYPRDVLPLYAQGYSLARYLIAQGGKRKFVRFVGDGMNTNDWNAAITEHYGFDNLSDLQVTWLDWVKQGSPLVPAQPDAMFASHEPKSSAEQANPFDRSSRSERGQSETQPDNLVPVPPRGDDARVLLAENLPTDGWYSRQRNASTNENDLAPVEGIAHSTALERGPRYAPGSIKNAVPLGPVLSRPQPIGRPQETVLEPSRNGSPAPPQQINGISDRGQLSGQSYYEAAQNRQRTMMR